MVSLNEEAAFFKQPRGPSSVNSVLRSTLDLANASPLSGYLSPLVLIRLVTKLQWQNSSDIPPNFLEDLTFDTGSSPSSKLISELGWSLSGAAAREDAPGELVLDLLTCALSMRDAYGLEHLQNSGPAVGHSANGDNNFLKKPPTSPSSAAMPASSPNSIINTCTSFGAVSAYRQFISSNDKQSTDVAEGPLSPGMLMNWLHQASKAKARPNMQVLFQEETELFIMQLMPGKDKEGTCTSCNGSPFNNSMTPAWTHMHLDPSISMPGLLNLATQPCLVWVAPRCVASNGLSAIKLSMYGTYIQGGKMTARCGGRYLQVTWPTHESARVMSRAQLARWHRAGEEGEGEESSEPNMEMVEMVILDPPSCGLIAIECRQGYLVSKPVYVLVVPATQAMARELTSGLACPPPSLEVLSRSRTQCDLTVELAGSTEDKGDLRVPSKEEDIKERLLSLSRSKARAKHLEVVKDSISRDMGAWLQFMYLTRRQLGYDSRLDLAPGSALIPISGTSSNLPSRSSMGTKQDGMCMSISKEGPHLSLSKDWVQSLPALQPNLPNSNGSSYEHSDSQKRQSFQTANLPSLNGADLPSTDFTLQLSNVAIKSRVHMANMIALGVRLLQLACDVAWPCTARTILTGLMDLGLSFQNIEAQASEGGLSFLHRAVRSRNAGMVAEVAAWADATKRKLDWGVADEHGVTPLHLAACLDDGGLLAIHILRKWPAAGQLWLTKEAYKEKLTPKNVAEGVGNDFLNRMADMAGLLKCRNCTEMACAMRLLPGQLSSGSAPSQDSGFEDKNGNPKAKGDDKQLDLVAKAAWAIARSQGFLPTVPERVSKEWSGSVPVEGSELSATGLASGSTGTTAVREMPVSAWEARLTTAAATTPAVPAQEASKQPTAPSLGTAANAPSQPQAASPCGSSPKNPRLPPLPEQQPAPVGPHQLQQRQATPSASMSHQEALSGCKDVCCAAREGVHSSDHVSQGEREPPSPPMRKKGLCGLL